MDSIQLWKNGGEMDQRPVLDRRVSVYTNMRASRHGGHWIGMLATFSALASVTCIQEFLILYATSCRPVQHHEV